MQIYEAFNDTYSLLPVRLYKHDLHGNFIYAPLHWHRSVEITVTLSGSIRFNTGSNNFDSHESNWVISNSAELHSCRYINPDDHFVGISIIISLPYIEKWIGKNLMFHNPEMPAVTDELLAISHELYHKDEKTDNYNLFLMSKLFQILHLISNYCIAENVSSAFSVNDNKILNELTDYIEQHYQENLTLDSIATIFNYSSSYFSRMFKETLGVNFHSYLNFVRVCHAAEELSNGNDNLTNCALSNGFPNMKSFIQTFKKLYGCTPSAFLASQKK